MFFEYLNQNQGVISFFGILFSVIVTIIGFFVTNKKISKKMNQKVGKNSVAKQAGRDFFEEGRS